MSLFFLLWMACDQPGEPRIPTWTAEESLRSTWELLDSNDDGTVKMNEWGPVSYGSPVFPDIDKDASGGLDLSELLAVVREIDPDGFDGKRMKLKSTAGELAASSPVPREVRHVGNVLKFLAADLEEEERLGPIPSKQEVLVASWTRSLSSPESAAALAQLREAWRLAGRTFPEEISMLIDQPGAQ